MITIILFFLSLRLFGNKDENEIIQSCFSLFLTGFGSILLWINVNNILFIYFEMTKFQEQSKIHFKNTWL